MENHQKFFINLRKYTGYRGTKDSINSKLLPDQSEIVI